MKLDFRQIKLAALRAMFADDELASQLVFKGGSALDLIYEITTRSSLDLDFSVPGTLGAAAELRDRLERTLQAEFQLQGLQVFDVRVMERPPEVSPEFRDFWGGYRVQFKLISVTQFGALASDLENLRRNALVASESRSSQFQIDISKHEHCDGKVQCEIGDLAIYVYSLEMIVAEKLRAICQQLPEYRSLLRKSAAGRARDFVDIVDILDRHPVDVGSRSFRETLLAAFQAKRVPIALLGRLEQLRDFHAANFRAVQEAVRPGVRLIDFDFYFDHVRAIAERLKSLGDE